jgi:hypothetical protein
MNNTYKRNLCPQDTEYSEQLCYLIIYIQIMCNRKAVSEHQLHHIMADIAETATLIQLIHWQGKC